MIDETPRGAAVEVVHLTIGEGVATITLDSPGNRNALSGAVVDGLVSALDRIDDAIGSGALRAVVLTHDGPAFCAGADLKERRHIGVDDPDATDRLRRSSAVVVDVLRRLNDLPVPTIAAAGGPARAGGLGLLAVCDLVVVHETLTFALTEVRVGVAAAIISVPILARCSRSMITSAFLTGEPFDAEFARRAGLVTHVTADVTGTVAALLDGVRAGAPRAVNETKRILRDVPAMSPDDAWAAMADLSAELFAGPDAAEGMAAFAEKRVPAWAPPPR